MYTLPGVSVIVPSYNRRELLARALDSILAQTVPVDEIIVVDDGSTDGTGEMLQTRYGERVRHVWQANAGVSAARNRGLSLARGAFIALLDSDDLWHPRKTALQLQWLADHPDHAMVLCDVERVDIDGNPLGITRRRDAIPVDGYVLRWLVHEPSLVPASMMMRREVYETIGGFDESLRTAEDLEYHLRIARHFRIGVVEEALVVAVREHDGLSSLATTNDDYVRVIEHTLATGCEGIDDEARRQALATCYLRNSRGMIISGRWRDAAGLGWKAWRAVPRRTSLGPLAGLAVFAAKRAAHLALVAPRG